MPAKGLWVVCVLIAMGCSDRKTPAPSEPSPSPSPVAKDPVPAHDEGDKDKALPVKEHMVEHFARAIAIKDAVIEGDFAATREPSKWLAEHGAPASSPDEWVPLITELRKVAAGADEAKDVASVSGALARLAVVCGRCHTEHKVQIQSYASPKPVPDKTMLVHAWASDRLWEGLVIPDDSRWAIGVDALQKAELATKEGGADPGLGAKLKKLAGEAASAKDELSRADAFGKILATCGTCHGAPAK